MTKNSGILGGWGGAGPSRQFNDQQDDQGRGHWFNLRQTWVENPDSRYFDLPHLWREAIKNPGVRQETTWKSGSGPGSEHTEFAMFDAKRMQILSNGACMRSFNHHLYTTCWMCGQYG